MHDETQGLQLWRLENGYLWLKETVFYRGSLMQEVLGWTVETEPVSSWGMQAESDAYTLTSATEMKQRFIVDKQ